MTLIVPSTLPVGPVYGGSFSGFTNAATLAAGRGVPLAGAVGAGANWGVAIFIAGCPKTKTGAPVRYVGDGQFARCLQHATDHLHGLLFLDRLRGRTKRKAMREVLGTDWANR